MGRQWWQEKKSLHYQGNKQQQQKKKERKGPKIKSYSGGGQSLWLGGKCPHAPMDSYTFFFFIYSSLWVGAYMRSYQLTLPTKYLTSKKRSCPNLCRNYTRILPKSLHWKYLGGHSALPPPHPSLMPMTLFTTAIGAWAGFEKLPPKSPMSSPFTLTMDIIESCVG